MLEEKVALCDIMVAPSIFSGGDSFLKGRPDEKGVVPLAPFLETFGDVRIVMCYLGYCRPSDVLLSWWFVYIMSDITSYRHDF